MVTIKDIAVRLNVSASTVGRALAGDSRISSATKLRVSEVASEIGYVANRAARMMRGVSSNLVGLIVPDIRNSFYSTIAHALSKCLDAEHFQLALSESDDDRSMELRHVREMVSAGVAGIILVPSARPLPETVRLLQATAHVQLLRRHPSLGEQWFGMDDIDAIYQSTKHLTVLGHRRIAYIGGSAELPTGAARLKGFRQAMAAIQGPQSVLEELGAPSEMDFGRDALRRVLALANPPTAVVTGTIQHTQSVLEELYKSGRQIPNELSVVGFGDDVGFRWWGPGLTTVGLPVSELATACGLWFVHQMKQRPEKMARYNSVAAPKLILRGSTAAIALPKSRAQQIRSRTSVS